MHVCKPTLENTRFARGTWRLLGERVSASAIGGSTDVLVRNGSAGLAYRQAGVPTRNSGSAGLANVEPMPSSAKATIHTARLILAILNVHEYRNPAAWAANQRQAYLSVLRWCVANYGPIPKKPAAAEIAQKCYYHLGLFHRWEAVEKSRHILTSRQIEKSLRWNLINSATHGEFSAIRRTLKELKLMRRRTAITKYGR